MVKFYACFVYKNHVKKNADKGGIFVSENEICIVCVVLNIPGVSAGKDLNNMGIQEESEIYLCTTSGPISICHFESRIKEYREREIVNKMCFELFELFEG